MKKNTGFFKQQPSIDLLFEQTDSVNVSAHFMDEDTEVQRCLSISLG